MCYSHSVSCLDPRIHTPKMNSLRGRSITTIMRIFCHVDFVQIRKRVGLFSHFGYIYGLYFFYEYPIVGTTLFKADMTSFRLFPELVNTNIAWFLSPPVVPPPPRRLLNGY